MIFLEDCTISPKPVLGECGRRLWGHCIHKYLLLCQMVAAVLVVEQFAVDSVQRNRYMDLPSDYKLYYISLVRTTYHLK